MLRFRKNRTSGTPVRGECIPNFAKFTVFGTPYSHPEPIKVKIPRQITFIGATCRYMGRKSKIRPL